MAAPFGWRIDPDGSVSVWTIDAGDLMTVCGFQSRAEQIQFVALYQMLVMTRKDDMAARLVDAITKGTH